MKYTFALIAASAAITSAQITYNQTTGIFTCPPSALNGAFCAGDSLQTNIIIRCNNGTGQPGNCNDNLAGQPPMGVNFAPCYQTNATAGDAACSKNCIVYSPQGTFPVPGCNGTTTSSTTSSTTTPYPTGGSSTIVPPPNNGTTTTTPNPPITITTTSTGSDGSSTTITYTTEAPPTNVPVGPTTTGNGGATCTGTGSGPEFTGAAHRNSIGALIGAIGVAAVFAL